MDKLIERELLAGMAEKLGFVVTDEEVDDQIADGKIVALGGASVPVPMLQKEGRFNVRVLQELRPHPAPADAQRSSSRNRRRSCSRRACGTWCASSVTVSPDEVKSDFVRKNRQINLEYIRFTSRRAGSRGRARRTRRSPLTPARTRRS